MELKNLKEPLLIVAKNYNQFKAGSHWLFDNGYIREKYPIYIQDANQLRGIRDLSVFIMDGALTTDIAHSLRFGPKRLRQFTMTDTRERPELNFKIEEVLD